MLALFGAILLIPNLRTCSRAAGALSNSGNRCWRSCASTACGSVSWWGRCSAWCGVPCVGPTLGAATTLASQGKDLGEISALDADLRTRRRLPLVVLGSLSRAA